MSKFDRFIRQATLEAKKSTMRFKLGAALVKNNLVVASSCNISKTHPLAQKFGKWTIHAELRTAILAGLDASQNSDVYVVRIKKDGSFGMSKPCESCIKILNEFQVKSIYYINSGLSLSRLKL